MCAEWDPVHLPKKHLPERTFPRKTLGRMDIFPKVHFPERTLRAIERGVAGGFNDPRAHERAHRLQEGLWLQRAQQRANELERGPSK